MTVSGTMDALALEGFDKPPSLVSVPAPEPGAGEVLVRVTASSINAYDAFVAMGAMKEYITYEFPVVLGMDVAGVVESLGGGAEGVSVGDRVFGTMGMKGSVHDGSFGEWATPLASSLAIAPDSLDDQAAGTLGVAGTTAMSAVEAVAPGDGSTVLGGRRDRWRRHLRDATCGRTRRACDRDRSGRRRGLRHRARGGRDGRLHGGPGGSRPRSLPRWPRRLDRRS